MSKYNHGDWFCKPSTKEEAREIVERAVASGAADDYKKWHFCGGCYGVLDGVVNVVPSGAEYTIDEVRNMFPLPNEQINTKWNGEGLPPVGTVCMGLYRGKWLQCEILKHKVNKVGTNVAACDFGIDLAWSGQFQPLRTEREQWIEGAISAVGGKQAVISAENVFGKIYDSIKSGELKMPEERS